MELESPTYEAASIQEFIELAYQKGWTDGLPVFPPTREAIESIISYLGRSPKDVIGVVPPGSGVLTVEKLAINCAMAGCKPEYVPVVIAALEAMLEEEFNLNAVQCTTASATPITIVSGPVVKELGFRYRDGVFGGNGDRASATIGRAIRLVLWNVGQGRPGELSKATSGHPARWSYCFAEDPEWNPWQPLHVDQGMAPGDSSVTVCGVITHDQVSTPAGLSSVDDVLDILADSMCHLGRQNLYAGCDMIIMVNPLVAKLCAEAGYTKGGLVDALSQRARRPVALVKKGGGTPTAAYYWTKTVSDPNDDNAMVYLVRKPEHLHIVVAGGWPTGGGGFCNIIGGWVAGGGLRSRKVQFPTK